MGQELIRDRDTRYKHPDEIMDIPMDWQNKLEAVIGDAATVVSAVTTVTEGTGLTVVSTSVDASGRYTITRFSGGTDGVTYQYEVLATFSDGQDRSWEAYLVVRDN